MPADTTGYPPEFAALLDNYNQEVTALMARLEAGKVTSAAWTKEMQGLLAKYSQAARMLGMGEVKLLPAEVDAVRAWLNEQFKYLDGFETVINSAGGEYDPAWLPRAQMYGASTVTEYWEGKTAGLPLPAQPGQGTQCLSNCRCHWDIQWIDKQAGSADCFWVLNPTVENCQTCQTRAEMWNPIKVRGGDLEGEYETSVPKAPVPAQISMSKFEKQISKEKIEHGAVYDKNGKLLLQKNGNEDYIPWTDDEVAKMGGNILTHNHPNGSWFSGPDLVFLSRNKLGEMRAVVPDGVFILKPREAVGWGSPDKIEKLLSEELKKLSEEVNRTGIILNPIETADRISMSVANQMKFEHYFENLK